MLEKRFHGCLMQVGSRQMAEYLCVQLYNKEQV